VGPARAEDGRRRYIEARDHSSVLPLIAEKLFGWRALLLIVIAAAGFDGFKSAEQTIRAAR
jgi:hypothetical protein